MKPSDPKVIELLNDVLTGELTAINQYFLHGQMCKSWGLNKLYAYLRAESIDEMKHAEEVVDRILFLEGVPNLQRYFKVRVGETFPEQLEADLALENEAIPRLRDAIRYMLSIGDDGTRTLLERILVAEEAHVDWIEAQQQLIAQVGLQNYLAQQIHP